MGSRQGEGLPGGIAPAGQSVSQRQLRLRALPGDPRLPGRDRPSPGNELHLRHRRVRRTCGDRRRVLPLRPPPICAICTPGTPRRGENDQWSQNLANCSNARMGKPVGAVPKLAAIWRPHAHQRPRCPIPGRMPPARARPFHHRAIPMGTDEIDNPLSDPAPRRFRPAARVGRQQPVAGEPARPVEMPADVLRLVWPAPSATQPVHRVGTHHPSSAITEGTVQARSGAIDGCGAH